MRVFETKDLGFFYSLSLSFRRHIEYMASNTLIIIGIIRCHTTQFNPASCLVKLYCALVRSILNYRTIIWNPSLQIEKKLRY